MGGQSQSPYQSNNLGFHVGVQGRVLDLPKDRLEVEALDFEHVVAEAGGQVKELREGVGVQQRRVRLAEDRASGSARRSRARRSGDVQRQPTVIQRTP